MLFINYFKSLRKRWQWIKKDLAGLSGQYKQYDTITIHGDEEFIQRTIDAINLLKQKFQEAFLLIRQYIKDISMGSSSRIDVDFLGTGWCYIGNAYKSSTLIYASTLAHEAYHCKLYHEYRRNNPGTKKVPLEIYTGKEAEKKALNYKIGVLKKLGADEKILKQFEGALETRWWEMPSEDQDW